MVTDYADDLNGNDSQRTLLLLLVSLVCCKQYSLAHAGTAPVQTAELPLSGCQEHSIAPKSPPGPMPAQHRCFPQAVAPFDMLCHLLPCEPRSLLSIMHISLSR
jgi:hypothetical protein